MAHQGDPTTNRKDDTTSSTGGFVRSRVSLELFAAVVLAAAIFIGAAAAARGGSDPQPATLIPAAQGFSTVAETPTSSTSSGPTAIGSAWSMPPLPEPPTYVSSAIELPPLTRASSVSYSPR